MLVKWVWCGVVDRAAFDGGQQGWSGLRGLPGFLGQGGGYSRSRPAVAHIFSCWADPHSYETFMAQAHDRFAATQAGTYRSIEVRLFDRLMDIGGCLPGGFTGAALLRLAHCRVKADRVTHFLQAQADIWNPGMARAPGMRGGLFARRGEAELLVLSLWAAPADHERYAAGHLPGLRERAGTVDDLDSITGDLVAIEPTWTVHSGQ